MLANSKLLKWRIWMKMSTEMLNHFGEREYFDMLAKAKGETWWGSVTCAGINRLKRRTGLVRERLVGFRDPLVLELVCGTGAFTKCLLEELPLLKLIAYDISPECIRIANRHCNCYNNVKLKVGNVATLDHNANSFDAVIGNSILHHLPLENALRDCFRMLKPGGIVNFFEPNMMNPQIAVEKIFALLEKCCKIPKTKQHSCVGMFQKY